MITIKECQKEGYPARTIENVFNSNVTIAIAKDFFTAGERLTKNIANKFNKKFIQVPIDKVSFNMGAEVGAEINLTSAKYPVIINFAGNGIYTLSPKYTQHQLNVLLTKFLEGLSLICNIKQVRSGGQTGIDEAAVIAANSLGINTLVLAPKGWRFRDENSIEVYSKGAFCSRFQ